MDRLGVAVGLCWFSCLGAVVWVNLGLCGFGVGACFCLRV